MARVKLSEYKAKLLLYKKIGIEYPGISVNNNHPLNISLLTEKEYVVKVDQGIKKRMKNGLVLLKVKPADVPEAIEKLKSKGYSQFLIEKFTAHKQSEERYLSLERTREGIVCMYSRKGGIEIEDNTDSIQKMIFDFSAPAAKDIKRVAKDLGVAETFIITLISYFEDYYVSFLEINPLVVEGMHILDLAVEVDSCAQFLVQGAWNEPDIMSASHKTEEEKNVSDLNKKSQAALSLTVLNPQGSIWVLLSGGGASITIADELYNLGYGKELGNYGEYSGNPNAEETYLYTKEVLKLMSHSDKKKQVLIIGGGVANFTDIRITFKGVVRALEEFKSILKQKHIKLYVRRGGPYEKEGLSMIEDFAHREGLYGLVSGPELPLHEIVRAAIKELS